MADISLSAILKNLEEACRTYEPLSGRPSLEAEDLQRLLAEQMTDSRIHTLVGRLISKDFTQTEKDRIIRTLRRLIETHGTKAEGKLGRLLEAVVRFHQPAGRVLQAGG